MIGGEHTFEHLGADVNLAWPTAQIAVMGAQGAVNILYRRELEAAEFHAERRTVARRVRDVGLAEESENHLRERRQDHADEPEQAEAEEEEETRGDAPRCDATRSIVAAGIARMQPAKNAHTTVCASLIAISAFTASHAVSAQA